MVGEKEKRIYPFPLLTRPNRVVKVLLIRITFCCRMKLRNVIDPFLKKKTFSGSWVKQKLDTILSVDDPSLLEYLI